MIFDLKQFSGKEVAISCHTRPDGDAIGSCLALYRALKMLGVSPSLFCDCPVPQKFLILADSDKFSLVPEKAYDALILVDCFEEERTNLRFNVRERYVIDHHKTSNAAVKNAVIRPEMASASQIVLQIIEENGLKIDADTADCLYTGLMTDTGNFAHTNTDERAFSDAKKLLEYGARANYLCRNIFKLMSKGKLKLLAEVLSCFKYYEGGKIALYYVSRKMLKDAGEDNSATEGLIEYALNVEGVQIAIGIMENGDNDYKISLRSIAGIDVSLLAKEFGGGGHAQASGLQLQGNYYDVVDKITYRASLYTK